MSMPVVPISHYRYENKDIEYAKDLWVDWYTDVIFVHEGKKYSMVVCIMTTGSYPVCYLTLTAGDLKLKDKVNESLSKIEVAARTPFTHYNEIQPGDIEMEHFFAEEGQIARYDLKDVQFNDLDDGSFRVALGPDERCVEFIFKPDGVKIIKAYSKGVVNVELTCKPKAPPLYWGNKKDFDLPWSKDGMTIRGTEELCAVEGNVTYKGSEMPVKGSISTVEHVWIKKMDWMDWRYMDWTWFHSDKVCGLISHGEMKDEYHWEWGTIYLTEEKKQLHCTSNEFRNEELAWSPEHMRFIPIKHSAVCKTDEGVLELKMNAVKKPIKRTGRFDPEYVASRIQGWAFTFWTVVVEVEGTFTYNDGRVIEIKNGLGMNEPQAVSPIT